MNTKNETEQKEKREKMNKREISYNFKKIRRSPLRLARAVARGA